MKLIIPSSNRPLKLNRTLNYYNQISNIVDLDIFVLNGSDDYHKNEYSKILKKFKVESFDWSEFSLIGAHSDLTLINEII